MRMMITLILVSVGTGLFSFFWIYKLSMASTPVTGWITSCIRWFDFWFTTKFKKGIAVYLIRKLTFLLTECELCFSAQLALWTGIFYFSFDWFFTLMFIGTSMFFAALTSKIIGTDL